MDPGSALRSARNDGAFFVEVQAFENKGTIVGQAPQDEG